jgi:hypothetical protein
MNNNKLCKYCKWCNTKSHKRFAKCNYILRYKKSVVDGEERPVYQEYRFCDVLRQTGFFNFILAYLWNICGPQGRFFTPKKEAKRNGKNKNDS